MRYKDYTIDKVLLYNSSTLNVLPKYVMDVMVVDSTHIPPNTITVRAYDGSPKQVARTIEIELFINLQVFLVTLQMMDIHPLYNMLLERLLMYVVGVMTSFLH